MTDTDKAVEVVRKALTSTWHDETPADYPDCGGIHDSCDCIYPEPALDILVARIAELKHEVNILEGETQFPTLQARIAELEGALEHIAARDWDEAPADIARQALAHTDTQETIQRPTVRKSQWASPFSGTETTTDAQETE